MLYILLPERSYSPHRGRPEKKKKNRKTVLSILISAHCSHLRYFLTVCHFCFYSQQCILPVSVCSILNSVSYLFLFAIFLTVYPTCFRLQYFRQCILLVFVSNISNSVSYLFLFVVFPTVHLTCFCLQHFQQCILPVCCFCLCVAVFPRFTKQTKMSRFCATRNLGG